jgi:hypothetical protein
MECKDHKKVYADYWLMTNPPRQPWICSECGEKGIDQEIHSRVTYEDIIRKFNSK